jgi:hypothetical protein
MPTIALLRTVALVVACLTLSRDWLRGAEVYVLRFRTNIIYADATRCLTTGWQDDVLFHNSTSTEKVIRLLRLLREQLRAAAKLR